MHQRCGILTAMNNEFIPLMQRDWLVTPQMVKASEDKPDLDHMYSYISGVVGTEYVSLDRLRNRSRITEAELIPEPDNEFDVNALGVWADGVKIGWVPSRFNEKIAWSVAFLRHSGNRCFVPIKCEDNRAEYKQIFDEIDFELDEGLIELRDTPNLGLHYAMYLPTFRTLFFGHNVSQAFEYLDRMWDCLSEEETEIIRQAGFHVNDAVAQLFLKHRDLVPEYPLNEPKTLQADWLLDQYLMNYRRRIYFRLKERELEIMKHEMYLRSLAGDPATKIAKDYPRSVGTVRKYINEMKALAKKRRVKKLNRPKELQEAWLREYYLREWSAWALPKDEREALEARGNITA